VPVQSIEVTPRIGSQAMLSKADLLSGEHAADIRALLVERGAVIVRDVHPEDSELREIARSLGDLRLGTTKRGGAEAKVLSEGDEGVMKISLDADINPDYARFLPGNHLWHMDGTYEEVPPFATLFTPFRLSKEGGDTMFANTYAAYEDLAEDDKAMLDGLVAVHTMPASLFPAMRDVTIEEFAVWQGYPKRRHPLVWRHKSGRKSLVLSTSAAWIEGMHPAESHNLLARLMAHATQDKYTYRHQWRMGDLAIWDNTGTMHRVMPYDLESKREFHRCTLNGEEPIRAAA
jgi:alpha-ketoglutarate-dependent taurine dioxygenase